MSAVVNYGDTPSNKYVINHDIMNCTAEGVTGNHLYSGRALGMSEPEDIIQIHPELERLWEDISRHYQRIGLSHSDNVLWDLDLKHLGSHSGYLPSVFYFGPQECRYWDDTRWMETVEFINSKNNFMALAAELGVPVPQTRCFDSVLAITPQVIQETVFPCYLKAAVSVSGVGIYRCADEAEFAEALGRFDPDVPVQVQEEVTTETFLNLQYQVSGNRLARLAASEQILDGFVHQGNRVPARHAPWDVVEPMAAWLQAHGMHGIFAFDVAVVQTDQGLRFPAIECNPRFNGASYPTLIAQKLKIPAWSAVTVTTQYRTLADIDLSGLEFDQQTGSGVILVNWGTVLVGKLIVLLAGTPAIQQSLLLELGKRL
ncbi:ATP-grasp domain-containing protein [Candidatus Thiothrix sp. Deng01]|uniref:ATP-grasp domain-containing protein n=1 Tax=Candidatus Thiothrix phosphatis TaxID=3112415 RepID=A0ABU6D270_9GAMM|nr:hypothetical protein [Candidatus Thiothrix sp. Deng01]MEB4593185.1 ATP-grasp domain-containing protein [Candidatus Thiothrix sp. Deng01]